MGRLARALFPGQRVEAVAWGGPRTERARAIYLASRPEGGARVRPPCARAVRQFLSRRKKKENRKAVRVGMVVKELT